MALWWPLGGGLFLMSEVPLYLSVVAGRGSDDARSALLLRQVSPDLCVSRQVVSLPGRHTAHNHNLTRSPHFWAWLPAEAVMIPEVRCSSERFAMWLYAPRILNEKTCTSRLLFNSTETKVESGTARHPRTPRRSGGVGHSQRKSTRANKHENSNSLDIKPDQNK